MSVAAKKNNQKIATKNHNKAIEKCSTSIIMANVFPKHDYQCPKNIGAIKTTVSITDEINLASVVLH